MRPPRDRPCRFSAIDRRAQPARDVIGGENGGCMSWPDKRNLAANTVRRIMDRGNLSIIEGAEVDCYLVDSALEVAIRRIRPHDATRSNREGIRAPTVIGHRAEVGSAERVADGEHPVDIEPLFGLLVIANTDQVMPRRVYHIRER